MKTARADQLPPSILPLLYLGFAHAALALALALVAFSPASYAGFFYHSPGIWWDSRVQFRASPVTAGPSSPGGEAAGCV